ncbi:hypothetical protein RJT34_13182 [Clitoria ternatea]|uniref:Uncharacterized protein n=1 Tax=Clitoria ternatea TaxID=43366 RepID=A0AAN9JQF7_CLITE
MTCFSNLRFLKNSVDNLLTVRVSLVGEHSGNTAQIAGNFNVAADKVRVGAGIYRESRILMRNAEPHRSKKHSQISCLLQRGSFDRSFLLKVQEGGSGWSLRFL